MFRLRTAVGAGIAVAGVVGLLGCSATTQDASNTNGAASGASIPSLDLPTTLGVPELAGRVVFTGERPVLAWDQAPTAVSYQLIVRNETGETTWAWSGAATSVAVGGGTQAAAADTPAALISGPSSWTVVALDAASKPVAATTDLEVSP